MSAQPNDAARSAVTTAPVLIQLKQVSKSFEQSADLAERAARLFRPGSPRRRVHAVAKVDLSIRRGEVVGLVGESGCGKSTLGRVVAGIHPQTEGEVIWEGQDRAALSPDSARKARLAVQMIFQDPYGSLNPRMSVGAAIAEAPRLHGMIQGSVDDFVTAQMRRVGLDPDYRDRYPHQLSGGQRQRVGIARALAVSPQLLVCDESIAALDVSIQAQVINLFTALREQLDLTYLFISHDLGVVEHLSDRVMVMYLGRVVEEAPTEVLFERPNHPYTQALLSQVPRIAERHRSFPTIAGEIPSPIRPPSGCHFHPRCPHAMPRCRVEAPALRQIGEGQSSACHLNDVRS